VGSHLVYVPSGHAADLDDECRDCRGVEFPDEVVMVYDPTVRGLYVICEACYWRRLARGRYARPPQFRRPSPGAAR
jgi:hypothetical protein